ELAIRTGVTQSSIARIEAGSAGARVTALHTLLRECGLALEVERLLGIGVDRSTFSFDAAPHERFETMAESSNKLTLFLADSKGQAAPRPFDPMRIVRMLRSHEVAYVLIGGMADAMHGGCSITD